MMDLDAVHRWMEGYLQAWHSNRSEDIGALFTPEANYFTAPYRQPWAGREAIIAGWLDRKDEPGEFKFRYEILGLDGEAAFVRGWTDYPQHGKSFSNLWVVRLDETGQCREFIEWWMEED